MPSTSVSVMWGAVASAALVSASSAAPVFTDFNLVTFGNLDSTSEVEGRAAIGGTLSGTASNYGTKLTPAGSFLSTDVLLVGGNISAGNINLNAGNARRGGSRSGNLNLNGGGSEFVDGSTAAQVASLAAQASAASTFLKNLATTNTVSIPSGSPGPVNFTAGPSAVSVFAINGNALFHNSNVQQIDIAFGSASSVIINVAGTNITFDQGNFVGNFNSAFARSRVLWNFYEATTINFTSKAVNGAVLAPLANVSFQGVIEGSLWAKSVTQRGEVHLPLYTGYIPTPGTLGLAAVGGLLIARRRRTA